MIGKGQILVKILSRTYNMSFFYTFIFNGELLKNLLLKWANGSNYQSNGQKADFFN